MGFSGKWWVGFVLREASLILFPLLLFLPAPSPIFLKQLVQTDPQTANMSLFFLLLSLVCDLKIIYAFLSIAFGLHYKLTSLLLLTLAALQLDVNGYVTINKPSWHQCWIKVFLKDQCQCRPCGRHAWMSSSSKGCAVNATKPMGSTKVPPHDWLPRRSRDVCTLSLPR